MSAPRWQCKTTVWRFFKQTSNLDIPLYGQGEREPYGRGVEQRGYDLVHGVPRVTRFDRRQRLVMVAQRVHVEQPRGREQEREHVGQGHGHEHHVGGRAHVPFGQHDHDERVGHDGDEQQHRHDVAVHGPRVLHRHLLGDVQVTVRPVAPVRQVVPCRRHVVAQQNGRGPVHVHRAQVRHGGRHQSRGYRGIVRRNGVHSPWTASAEDRDLVQGRSLHDNVVTLVAAVQFITPPLIARSQGRSVITCTDGQVQ